MDDLLLLSFYFSNPLIKSKNIILGQYLGIFTLITISFVLALAGKQLNSPWIGLLGFVPIFLGIKALVNTLKRKEDNDDSSVSESPGIGLWNIALITIANGGDNIGVYTPLFVSADIEKIILYIFLFSILIALWCALGYYLVKLPLIKKTFVRYGHCLLPFFLIALGVSILIQSTNFDLNKIL
jgi:cadmium resistance protein CadD (predicted permease)